MGIKKSVVDSLMQKNDEGKAESVCKDLLCVICHSSTDEVFNINFKATAICKSCANAITLQQVKDLVHKNT